MTDEFLDAMASLWYDERPEFHGRFADFAGVDAHPRPVQRPIPVVVGGHRPPAYRRAVARGQGWYGFTLTPEDTAACIDGLRRAAADVERPGGLGELEISVTPRGRMTRRDGDGLRRARRPPSRADAAADGDAPRTSRRSSSRRSARSPTPGRRIAFPAHGDGVRRRGRGRGGHLGDRRGLPPADDVPEPLLRDPGEPRRHRRHVGPLPLPGRALGQRHAHARLPLQAVDGVEGDRRRPVDPGLPARDGGRVRHRPAHPLPPPRAAGGVVDRGRHAGR